MGVLLVVCLGVQPVLAQTPAGADSSAVSEVQDSLPTRADSLTANDTLPQDSLPPDSLAGTPDTSLSDSAKAARQDSLQRVELQRDADLSTHVDYQAADSIVFDVTNEKLFLYTESQISYEDMNLESARIQIDWAENMVYAQGVPNDSTGDPEQTPIFTEDQDVYYAEEMAYNFTTRKGRITYANTNQQGDIVRGDSIQRNPDNTYFVKYGKFTTCDADHPHYYFKADKIKVIPGKQVISGRAQMYVADVPTPLIVPFGLFPNNKSRTSGIILPEYGESDIRGFFFRNMGYYWAVNDYLDLKFTGDLFTKGSYRFNVGSRYRKRYLYSGNANVEYSILGNEFERSDLAFTGQRTFFINWQHQQNLNPYSSFNANVNAGSSQHLRINNTEPGNYLQNVLQSSVQYQTSFPNTPWSLSAGLNHRQEINPDPTQVSTVSLNLPNIALQRARTFPFQNLGGPGRKWYKKVGVNYSAQFTNQINVPDSVLFTPEARDDWRNGLRHSVSSNVNFNVLNYIVITPSVNYNEYWYLERTEREFVTRTDLNTTFVVDSVQQGDSLVADTVNVIVEESFRDSLVTRQERGFNAGRDFNAGLTASTTLYGLWQPKSKRRFAFRHTFRPNLSYRYRPDFGEEFWGYYETIEGEATGQENTYSRFDGLVYGGPGRGEQQVISLNLQNVFETKYLRKGPNGRIEAVDSTGKPNYKYVTLLDNLGMNASYNLAADSLKLSNITFNARSNILDGKVTINSSATLDPYYYLNLNANNPEAANPQWQRVDRFALDEEGKIGRISNARVALTTQLRGKRNTPERDWEGVPKPRRRFEQRYMDFQMPVNLNLSYALTFNRPTPEPGELQHSLNFNGSVDITRKWRMNFTSNFDIETRSFGYTTLNIARDLHCWEFAFQWIPFGFQQSYFLTIRVKAQTLRDLKLEKRRLWQDNFNPQR